MFEELGTLLQSKMTFEEALIPIMFSLLAAIVTYLMYQVFYGSRHIGAGVHRSFLIGGPAITTLFLGIQTSIPLSLDLLGALSFVRFRTPVKDPAEIGFLLLLIASSIGAATQNYMITGLLFILVFLTLSIQWLMRNRMTFFGLGHLMISVDQDSFPSIEQNLTAFIKSRLSALEMESMSNMDGRVSLQYRYRRRPGTNWADFTSELNRMAEDSKVEVFIS